ncbi:MAG: glycosyltransferase family 2 protein [Deltaproteobacteria bacterium]|nr:glycosyltransferase family 2 protein [Deltaproteobacteria bacterium]
MELSVIIVNWNTRDLVLECLRSLYRDTSGLSTEVLVVDNGSCDGSAESIRAAFPGVILIENSRNLGFARAGNQGLARSRGRYILFLNTDGLVQEGAVRLLLDFMEATPRAAIVGPQLLNPDGSKQNSFDNFPTLISEGLNKSLLRLLFPARYPSKRLSFSSPVEVESAIGACLMVRRDAIDDVGPMDEDYFFFMEETDWCFRMRQRGWKVYLVPQARVIHLQGRTAGRVKARARVEYYRSRYLFFKKNRGELQAGALRVILFLKLSVALPAQGLICFLTLFLGKRARRKLAVTWTLFLWHVRLCPEKPGLKEYA